jgi:hypothetical protein
MNEMIKRFRLLKTSFSSLEDFVRAAGLVKVEQVPLFAFV